jgi:hypothetical protein
MTWPIEVMPHDDIASFYLVAVALPVEGRISVSSFAPRRRRYTLYAWIWADLG